MTEPVAQAGALAVSSSRLGVYPMQGTPGARNIVESGPRLMQAFDPHKIPGVLQLVRDYKQLYPSGKVVLHVYAGTQDLHYGLADDPIASAADYWQKALLPAVGVLSAADRQLIDYVSGPNEYNNTPPIGSAAEAEWAGAFWSRLADLIKEAGFRPNLGEIPVGHPDIGKLDQIMPALAPALRHIRSLDGIWSYHAYTLQYTTDPGVEIWYSLRYRQLYSYLRQHYPDLGDMPMILTETGVDERGDPATSGWKARGDAAKYKNWLTWFDKEIQSDPYIIGATIFQIGDSYWSSFDIEEISGWLAGYLSGAAPNLLQNPGFELDANADGRPDSWTSNSRFTRSSTVKRSGSYAGRFRAADNSGTTISQTISGLAAGAAYTFAGWVNIPSTGDAFTFKLEVRWLKASGSSIRTDAVKTYGNTSPQNVWDQAAKSMVAPTGTASAQVRMVVSSLNATIYVDDFVFQGASSPGATATPAPAQTPTATRTPSPTTQVSTPTRTPAPTATPGAGTSFTFDPVVDTYVSQASPGSAYGGSTGVSAVGGSTGAKQAFLRFDVKGLPAGAVVSSARLRLVVTNDSTSGGLFHLVTNTTWEEGITWTNKPSIDGPLLASVGAVAMDQVVEVVLPAGTITGNGLYSFAITLPSTITNTLGYASREASTSANRPQLVITTR